MSENESKALTVRGCPVPAVSEPATGQYADMEQLDIQSMFDQLLKQANHAAHEAETHLQVEEKSNSVAELQVFCAGIRNFKSAANKAGFIVLPALFDTANRMEPWVRGRHRGFTWVKKQIKELHYWKSIKEQQAEKRAKEKASELPFGDDVA